MYGIAYLCPTTDLQDVVQKGELRCFQWLPDALRAVHSVHRNLVNCWRSTHILYGHGCGYCASSTERISLEWLNRQCYKCTSTAKKLGPSKQHKVERVPPNIMQAINVLNGEIVNLFVVLISSL